MKYWLTACLLIIVVVAGLLGEPSRAQEPPGEWEQVGVGIAYREILLPGPIQTYVARMDRHNNRVTLESSLAQGKMAYGMETVSGMAQRYNQSIGYWNRHWGSRSRVVVAINGSFVVPSSGAPQSGQVQSGWYAKRFDDLGGSSGFAWTMDRSAFIGGCVVHRPEKQIIRFANGNEMTFHGVNVPRVGSQVIIYTPQYDSHTHTGANGVEVLVEMAEPLMIMPSPAAADGVVREIRDGQGSSLIPFDHIVISAAGSARAELLANLKAGDIIHISQEVTHYDNDCATKNDNSWTKTYTSISGSFAFLKNGEVFSFDNRGAIDRHPRTAVAFNDDYIFFIVVDGRDEEHSIGMTIDELGWFSRDVLGATWGIAQDGGGSSTMLVNGKVRNQPSVTCYHHYLPLISQDNTSSEGQSRPRQKYPAQGEGLTPACERNVANGLMMVVVEDMNASSLLVTGDEVSTRGETYLHLGPGTNYAHFATFPEYIKGVVVEHPLNGVFAKGYYWWKVDLMGVVGWTAEHSLTPYIPARETQYRSP